MVERKDVEAALHARGELGAQYEPEIVDNLVDQIEKRLDERLGERKPPAQRPHHAYDVRVPLGSIALGVGATAIATGNHAAWLAVIVWVAIALINIAYAQRR
jgi:hypothetical protein